jgi:hypothetical protein
VKVLNGPGGVKNEDARGDLGRLCAPWRGVGCSPSWKTASFIEDRDGGFGYSYIATGYIDNRLHKLIYALRGDKIRVTSLRKANKRERYEYCERRG